MYNFLNKELNNPIGRDSLLENYLKILKLLNPFIPHFTAECLSEFQKHVKVDNFWPEVDLKIIDDEKVNLVIQINGKKRDIINIPKNMKENEIVEKINRNEKLNKYIKDKKILKKIFVQNKIMNLIIK